LPRWENNQIIVGGKDHAESNLHAAMISLMLRAQGLNVVFNYNMSYSSRVYTALLNRDIDIYPEYDSSLLYEYLHVPFEFVAIHQRTPGDDDLVNNELQKRALNLKYLPHFGFDNPYVLVMKRQEADRLGLIANGTVTISALSTRAATDLALASDQ